MLYQLWHQCLFLWTYLCISTSRSVAEESSVLIYESEHSSEIAIISNSFKMLVWHFPWDWHWDQPDWLGVGDRCGITLQAGLENRANNLKYCNRKRIELMAESWVSLSFLLFNLEGWSQFNILTCNNKHKTNNIYGYTTHKQPDSLQSSLLHLKFKVN